MDDVTVRPGLVIPAGEIELSTTRASGPGGQSVNTTDSAVVLRLDVTGCSAFDERQRATLLERLGPRLTADGVLIVRASRSRSQHRNRDEARRRLAALLRDALRPVAPRRPTRVPRAQRQRRLDDKRMRGERKQQRRRPQG